MINGDRIKQVRELRGLTQTGFAQSLGVTQSTIAQIESGRVMPSEELLQRIVLQTGFPVGFFKKNIAADFPLGSLLFRARASMTLRERNEALQFARTVLEISETMENQFEKISLRLPRFEGDPKTAAIQTRSLFGLSPDSPVQNLTNLLEKNGILVIALPTKFRNRDAFSAWVGIDSRRPVITLSNMDVPGDRLRFNLAHELGHLVMHQAIRGDIKEVEQEANLFASEFLMPAESIRKEFERPITLNSLFPLKFRWKVSVQALIRRAHDLCIITDRQYKYLMYQLTIQGYRIKEPIAVPLEKPRMLGQMAEYLYGVPIDYKKMSNEMDLPFQLIKDTIAVHAINERSQDVQNKMDGRNVIRFERNPFRKK